MRLLYVLPPVDRGGVARSAWRMIEAMGRAGHEVAAAIADPNLFAGDVRTRDHTIRFGIAEPADPAEWIEPVIAAARRHRAEILIGYYGTTGGSCAARAAALLDLPAVVCLRGNDIDRDIDDPVRGGRLREAINSAAAIACVSRQMMRTVEQRFERGAHFVTNSVDRARFYPDARAAARFRARHGLGGFTIGLFGTFKPKRGLDRLGALDGSGLEIILVGQVRSDVRAQVAADWIQIPYLDDAELVAAYNACDVVLQPSHRDGMPNVVLEAMACARTVVGSRAGGIPDLIEHAVNGLLFEEAEELRRLIVQLRERPRPDLGEAARASVPSIDEERRGFERIFRSL